MNTSDKHTIVSDMLVVLSLTSLALLYLSSKPLGIEGPALERVLAHGSGREIQAVLGMLQFQSWVVALARSCLLGILVLIALLSLSNLRLPRPGKSQ